MSTMISEVYLAKIDSDLTLLKWMVGFNLAATLGVVMLLLRQ